MKRESRKPEGLAALLIRFTNGFYFLAMGANISAIAPTSLS